MTKEIELIKFINGAKCLGKIICQIYKSIEH